MKNKFDLFNKKKWHFIAMNNLGFLIFWFIIFGSGRAETLNFSIIFATFYLVYIFLSSIFISSFRDKYLYIALSTIFLLLFSALDFYNQIILGKFPKLTFSYPDILADFYFYIYFPILSSLISKWIGEIIHSQKTKKK